MVASLEHPTVDMFIGRDDRLLRRATLDLDVREPAKGAAQLDGVSSMGVTMALDYAQLNHRQTIAAPPDAKPYGELSRQLLGLGAAIGDSGAGLSNRGRRPQRCRRRLEHQVSGLPGRAGQSVTKLRKCASLIDATGR